ncbi:MAG: ATP-dependent DNA helicase UvrD2 [Geodermatophilaceae bacterium]|nr:ATP-dependent DNA helicase UvrD2 [Geodermatophilaceae bacterium]
MVSLDPEQQRAALALHGPVCILAGAGTGKTRTITHRIAHAVATEQVAAGQVLAVTFTARAAGELRSRLRQLGADGVSARTFHAAALAQLKYFAPRVLGGPIPPLIENKARLVAAAASAVGAHPDRALVRDLAGEIEWAKTSLIAPEDYRERAADADRHAPLEFGKVGAAYARYEQSKSDQGALDFEDLLLVTAYSLESHRDVCAEVRARYRYFVVDEYQDVNPLQQRLLDVWLGDRDDLCVVGDPRQTIYSFTGASPNYLLQFTKRFPNAEVIRLHRDYRSTPQIVGLANRLMSRSTERETVGMGLVGQRPDGPVPTISELADEPAEAASVAAQCLALIAEGLPPAEIAVLFRINAASAAYEAALAQAGVPYVLHGGQRYFDRPEVRQALVLLRAAARSEERYCLPEPTQPGGECQPEPRATAVAGASPLPSAVRDVLTSMGWVADDAPSSGAALERWGSLAALVDLALEMSATASGAQLSDLVTELEGRAAAQHAPAVPGVTLASMHSAKGLEWDAVFCVGLVDGLMPIAHAKRAEEIEEERRLLYVALTRARERLALSWHRSRQAGGSGNRRRSRFLTTLDGEHDLGDRRRKSASKQRRADLEPGDAEIFERLRVWRADQAKAGSVPAYVIFSDATLIAIAESRPRTEAQLRMVSGVGPTKWERYGGAVLAVVSGESPDFQTAIESSR